jgi:four helix bundle protein
MHMTREEMRERTKAYAQRTIKVCESLPNNWVARTLGPQLLRCGTSVGANYRAVCRAKSKAGFLHKLRIVEEECDESLFWMELLTENEFVAASRLNSLIDEGDQLIAIFVASAKTLRANSGRPLKCPGLVNRKS